MLHPAHIVNQLSARTERMPEWDDKFEHVSVATDAAKDVAWVEGLYRSKAVDCDYEIVYWTIKGVDNVDEINRVLQQVQLWAATDSINTVIDKMDVLGHEAKRAQYFGVPPL